MSDDLVGFKVDEEEHTVASDVTRPALTDVSLMAVKQRAAIGVAIPANVALSTDIIWARTMIHARNISQIGGTRYECWFIWTDQTQCVFFFCFFY